MLLCEKSSFWHRSWGTRKPATYLAVSDPCLKCSPVSSVLHVQSFLFGGTPVSVALRSSYIPLLSCPNSRFLFLCAGGWPLGSCAHQTLASKLYPLVWLFLASILTRMLVLCPGFCCFCWELSSQKKSQNPTENSFCCVSEKDHALWGPGSPC